MDTFTLEQAVNNPEVTEKIYNELEKVAKQGHARLQDSYDIILETIVIDLLKIK